VPDRLDFHNHVIPNVDDGAPTLDVALGAIETMRAQGIGDIIASPHLRASVLRTGKKWDDYAARVDDMWEVLRTAAGPSPVRLHRGFEILLDEPTIDLSNPLLRLAGSSFVLVEFPFEFIPPHSADALFNIRVQNRFPIVAHPERYLDIQQSPGRVVDWLRVGALLQSNAGSFVGHYGRAPERIAWRLLKAGVISYVCSDYHATGPCHSAAAARRIERKYGKEIVDLLFSENPLRILRNEPPLPVSPKSRGFFSGLIKKRNRNA
jgi:protein-tyrosine phosphatase